MCVHTQLYTWYQKAGQAGGRSSSFCTGRVVHFWFKWTYNSVQRVDDNGKKKFYECDWQVSLGSLTAIENFFFSSFSAANDGVYNTAVLSSSSLSTHTPSHHFRNEKVWLTHELNEKKGRAGRLDIVLTLTQQLDCYPMFVSWVEWRERESGGGGWWVAFD